MKAQPAAIYLAITVWLTGCAAGEHNYLPPAGYVPDERTAVQIAEAVWTPIYGEFQLASERPFRAELHGNVWHVYGSLPAASGSDRIVFGGVAEASIDRRTGRIIRVSHGE